MFKFKIYFHALLLSFCPTLSASVEPCDALGALEADPNAVAPAVAFQDIQPTNLIEACAVAIDKTDDGLPRFLLQRGRGYLRAGDGTAAMADIQKSHDMGYSAATFGLATAYHLGDDVKQDFEMARALYELAYEEGVRWAAKGLSMLHANEAYEFNDLEISNLWNARFHYNLPNGLSASPKLIDEVMDTYYHECVNTREPDIEFEGLNEQVTLGVDAKNFYDVTINAKGTKATVIYAAFACPDMGYMWSGSGGSPYYLIVGGDIFEGWGGTPYTLQHHDTVHLILPRAGGACDGSDELIPSNASACHGIANWDESLQGFNSIGNQLPIWDKN